MICAIIVFGLDREAGMKAIPDDKALRLAAAVRPDRKNRIVRRGALADKKQSCPQQRAEQPVGEP